jgi:small subunit ribosomal protein S19
MLRNVFTGPHLMRKVDMGQAADSRKPINTWSRRSTIPPDFVRLTSQGHPGNHSSMST